MVAIPRAVENEVSTGVAAKLLGVSRLHVAKLVDSGALPGRHIRRHRRARLTDVMDLKRMMENRHSLPDELGAETESLERYNPAVE